MHKRSVGQIRVGIGGWTYEPWRGSFFPSELARARELEYASRQVTSIEINGTYYRLQTPATFAKWRDATPDDFVFSVKAPRYATNRTVLAEAGESIERFLKSGVTELGAKLGPILWQLAPTKRFDAADIEGFFKLLPPAAAGLRLRHVLDARHDSFMSGEFLAVARQYGIATVFADSDEYPSFADLSADFVYVRLMRSAAAVKTGYAPKALAAWANRARAWAGGSEPDDVPRVEKSAIKAIPRDVYIYVINGAKERAPGAARALLARL